MRNPRQNGFVSNEQDVDLPGAEVEAFDGFGDIADEKRRRRRRLEYKATEGDDYDYPRPAKRKGRRDQPRWDSDYD